MCPFGRRPQGGWIPIFTRSSLADAPSRASAAANYRSGPGAWRQPRCTTGTNRHQPAGLAPCPGGEPVPPGGKGVPSRGPCSRPGGTVRREAPPPSLADMRSVAANKLRTIFHEREDRLMGRRGDGGNSLLMAREAAANANMRPRRCRELGLQALDVSGGCTPRRPALACRRSVSPSGRFRPRPRTLASAPTFSSRGRMPCFSRSPIATMTCRGDSAADRCRRRARQRRGLCGLRKLAAFKSMSGPLMRKRR